MAEKNKKRLSPGWHMIIIIMALVDFALILRYFLRGKNIALFNPKGLIAQEQHNLMVLVAGVLFTIAIPTISFMFYVAWKYRESNPNTIHKPPTPHNHGKKFVAALWVLPTAVILVLAGFMWSGTHRLAPQKTIASNTKPLTIQVISLRWKWVFIYPEQKIATVNFVQLPVNTPVRFELTADKAPMSSFWIPNLGGQLYTMTGHVNPLNLIAEIPGDYPGKSAEINGAGFSGMTFTARASYSADFDLWVQEVKKSPEILDARKYDSLVEPSENNPPVFYATYDSNLYDKVVMKYTGPEGHTHHE